VHQAGAVPALQRTSFGHGTCFPLVHEFDLEFGFVSLPGRKSENEDFAALLVGQGHEQARGAIAAIADGVSTGGFGREAAQTTVTTLVRDYFGTPKPGTPRWPWTASSAAQNAWLAGINRRRQPALGLTTLTALVLRGQTYTVAHVGDTRAYLVRDGEMQQLTVDHVMPHTDFAHQLTRAVGLEERLLVDYSQGDLQSGDTFVLLSDGVHGSLPGRDILALLARGWRPG
jgi:serine/threonine protein phosphatase PrpC